MSLRARRGSEPQNCNWNFDITVEVLEIKIFPILSATISGISPSSNCLWTLSLSLPTSLWSTSPASRLEFPC